MEIMASNYSCSFKLLAFFYDISKHIQPVRYQSSINKSEQPTGILKKKMVPKSFNDLKCNLFLLSLKKQLRTKMLIKINTLQKILPHKFRIKSPTDVAFFDR